MLDPPRPAASATGPAFSTVPRMTSSENLPARPAPASPLIPTGADAVAAKSAAAAARTDLARRVADVEKATAKARADLEAQRRSLEAEFARRKAELDAQMAPMRAQLAQMTEVAWSIDLYLGRDEDLTLLRDGAPAPAETPITIRQKVLVMAEESLVLLDRDKSTGMDHRNINTWVQWVLADPAHLDQLLPEPKGVVVLIPTRVKSRSGNMFEDAARNEANSQAWWLLRNGERLHLLSTDPELRLTERVLPRRTEFTEVFEQRLFGFGRAGERLEPGSQEWLKLEARADERRRHYMRIMLVLQGLLDRTSAWAPLPEGGVNLLDVRAQTSGKVVLLADDEDSMLLTDGRESFRDWQTRLNAQLRTGLRVIGAFRSSDFDDLRRDWNDRWSSDHPRLHPSSAPNPPSEVPLLIEGQRAGGFVVRYERTDQVWRRNVPVPGRPGYVYPQKAVTPTQRASCVIKADDTFVLPFDLATVQDLRYYLASRTERGTHFLTMVPVLRAALAAKEAEAAQEAPFRQLLTDRLLAEGADPERVADTLDELVHWWKCARHHGRALNGEPAHEARALREILARHRELARAQDPAGEQALVATARRALPDAIAVGRTRSGAWRAYVPSSPVPARDRHVHLDVVELDQRGNPKRTDAWKLLPVRSASALTVAWAAPAWQTWPFGANRRHYLSAPQREQAMADLLATAPGLPLAVTEHFDPAHPERGRVMAAYSWATGRPSTTDPRPVDSPLSWHHERGAERMVTVTARVIEVGNDGQARLGPQAHDGFSDVWGTYSGETPWWPDTGPQYNEVRPWLAWSDEAAVAELQEWVARGREAYKAERARKNELDAAAWRYVPGIGAAIRAEQEAAARARFDEDFPGAEDLWPAHLAALKLSEPIHQHDLYVLVRKAQDGGHQVAGRTLSALFARVSEKVLRTHNAGTLEKAMPAWGHIVVPDPAD